MSVASVNSPTGGSAKAHTSGGSPASVAGAVLLARVREPSVLVMLGLLLGAIGFLFHTWFANQNEHSWGNADWSHAYFVPLISVYLLWQCRERVAKVNFSVFWPGLVPVLLGVWSYVFFNVGVPNHLGQGLGLITTVFGVALLLAGPRAMVWLFFPIAYLGFAITVPEKVMNYLTYPLQDIAARGSWVLLNLFGFKTDIQGNVIAILQKDMTFRQLNVAEQCSGMRMVIAFVALSAVVALVGTRMWWKRVVLLSLGAPVAVFLNIIRVAVLGALTLVNPDLASGEAHMFIGTVLLVPGFFLYLAVLVALNKAVPEKDTSGDSSGTAAKAGPAPKAGATA